MLNKEECLNALETLCTYADCYPSYSGEFVGKMLQEADDTLRELIEEHFDNQPLKFEELKENMWVWDNKYKDYVKFKRNDNENVGKIIIFSKGGDEEYLRMFKDNSFYRREVKDDDYR